MSCELDFSAELATRRRRLRALVEHHAEQAARLTLVYAARPTAANRQRLVSKLSAFETASAFLEAIS